MRSWSAVPLLLALCLPWPAAAEEIEPLPVDFVEYLTNFESDEENWTLFADEERKQPAAKSPHRRRPRTQPPPAPSKTSEADPP